MENGRGGVEVVVVECTVVVDVLLELEGERGNGAIVGKFAFGLVEFLGTFGAGAGGSTITL